MDVFLSEENKPTRPVIVSPANETMEVNLGKWASVRVCWNRFFFFFKHKSKINCIFTIYNLSHLLYKSINGGKVTQIIS